MKEHVGVNSLKNALLKIKPLLYVAAAPKFNDTGCYQYIFQWIEQNLGLSTLNELIEKAKKLIDPAVSALNTNFFEQTYFTDKNKNKVSYLENIKCPSIFEDLAILSVYGDARTDPEENIDKLLSRIENEEKMREILKKNKFHLKYVQDQTGPWTLRFVKEIKIPL